MTNYFLFVFMSICLIILPGPDTAITTKNTLMFGKTGGFKTTFGICCALMIHTIAAVAGLSALIVKSAFLFSVIKYVGAIYLIYLGVKVMASIRKSEAADRVGTTAVKSKTYKSGFLQGFFTNLLNPKIAVFFLTFLPQFLAPGHNTFIPFFIMGGTYLLLTAVWFIFYILLIDHVSSFMKKPSTERFVQAITGIVLIGFGLKLAIEKE